MHDRQEKLIEYMRMAYSQERALITTLQGHIAMTKEGNYKHDLEHHLTETTGHARRIRQRLLELGYRDEEHIVQRGLGLLQSLGAQGVALMKAPIDLVRGRGDLDEVMLRNARDEAMTEALEIATYLAIERFAVEVDDEVTAELARSIRTDEEAMLGKIGEAIPQLAGDLMRHEEIADELEARRAS